MRVPISGSQVELVFDEDLDETVAGNLNDSVFSLTVAGQAVTIADYDFQEATLFLYVQTGTIKQGQTVVVSYTDPTTGDDTVALQDSAGNDVASFTTGMSGVPAVTNDSTVVNTAPTAGDNTVTTGEDRAYTFTADDFGFMDADAGAALASVKIVTVPDAGHAGARQHGGHTGSRRHWRSTRTTSSPRPRSTETCSSSRPRAMRTASPIRPSPSR